MRKPPVLRFVLSSFFVFLFGLADRFFDSFGQLALETGNATAQGRPSGRVGWRVWTAAWPSTAKGFLSTRPWHVNHPVLQNQALLLRETAWWSHHFAHLGVNCFKISRILINSLVCLDWGVWGSRGFVSILLPSALRLFSGAFDLSLDVLLSAW